MATYVASYITIEIKIMIQDYIIMIICVHFYEFDLLKTTFIFLQAHSVLQLLPCHEAGPIPPMTFNSKFKEASKPSMHSHKIMRMCIYFDTH